KRKNIQVKTFIKVVEEYSRSLETLTLQVDQISLARPFECDPSRLSIRVLIIKIGKTSFKMKYADILPLLYAISTKKHHEVCFSHLGLSTKKNLAYFLEFIRSLPKNIKMKLRSFAFKPMNFTEFINLLDDIKESKDNLWVYLDFDAHL